MANPKGNPENLNPVRTKEEARKRGAEGGKKSGIARRKKRNAKQAISLLLDMAAQGNLDKNLERLGYEEEDRTNMNAMVARMFTEAMNGNVNAFKAIMDYGGFHPDQQLRDRERRAHIDSMKRAVDYQNGGETGEIDELEEIVHIYLPDNGRDETD